MDKRTERRLRQMARLLESLLGSGDMDKGGPISVHLRYTSGDDVAYVARALRGIANDAERERAK